jgi:signal transduction histidine kinase
MPGGCSARGYRLLLGLSAAFVTLMASAAERPWRIVILNGTDPYLPAFIAIDRATRAELAAPGTHPAEIYSETLDMMRFPGAELEPEVLALLRRKYANQHIDAVISVTPAALAFAERHRDTLWPAAYIVFHSVSDEVLRGRTLLPQTTGVRFRHDVAGAAELALRLRPSAQRIVVIGGSSDFDRYVVAVAREQLQHFAKRVVVEFWVDEKFEDLADKIARLPTDAVVVQLAIDRDASGRMFVPREALAQLAAVSSVPIFSVFETFVGHGIVAGSVDDYDRRGRRAAQLLHAALSAPASTAPPPSETVPSICVADARELHRWGISEDLLPQECTVRFGEPSAWQRYRWQIVTGLAIIASQSLLIVALILQRRRRRHAEIETQAARTDLAHAARLASMGELTASIAHEIKQPLSAILAHADTAELLLENDAPSLPEIQRILAEIRKDDLRASDVITRLRDLLGRHTMERRPVDLNEAISDALAVVDAEARRRNVTVVRQLAAGLPPVIGDDVHLQQVVLNLVLNGMEAVAGAEESAGRITIGTTAVANGVQITVADNGPGIDPAIAPRLFESFATTKRGGLGLGLSIARTIVEAHGGTIEATAGAGHGAVFRVALPTTGADVDGEELRAAPSSDLVQ